MGPIHPACQKCTSEPQIPVDLTARYTSPSFRCLPACTSERVGVVSATQRSCLGFVKTPMFDLVGCSSVVLIVSVGVPVVVVVVVAVAVAGAGAWTA